MPIDATSPARHGPAPRVLWAGLLVFPLIATACGGEPEEEAQVARPIKMLTLAGGAGVGTLEYPGRVQPTQNAEMAFEVAGRITEFRFNEGDAVRRGQVLARLDPRDYEAARDQETARVNAARAEHQRYQELYASDAVSLQDLEVARRNFEVAQTRLRTAEKALEDTELRAPFAGIMARKLVQDFQNVRAKESVLVLQDESGLEVVINVPERDAVLAKPGLTPEQRTTRGNPRIELSSLPGRLFPAQLTEFSTAADPVTRTFPATFAFDAPGDVAVRSGMTAKVIITIPADVRATVTGFSLPANAVVSDEQGTPFVWVVDESAMTVSRAPVVLGELAGEDVEIRSGLSSGDVIAISGVHNLRDGMLVRRLPDN